MKNIPAAEALSRLLFDGPPIQTIKENEKGKPCAYLLLTSLIDDERLLLEIPLELKGGGFTVSVSGEPRWWIQGDPMDFSFTDDSIIRGLVRDL